MAKKQMRYRLSVPESSRHKTHIFQNYAPGETRWPNHAACGSFVMNKTLKGNPLTLTAIDKQLMKAPNPCKKCEIFAFNHIK